MQVINTRKQFMKKGATLYETLGVAPDATIKQIQAAYRKAVRECHPDHHPGDEAAAQRFKDLAEAFEILADPARRKRYDETGETEQTMEDVQALTMLAKLIQSGIRECLMQGVDPETKDHVKIARKTLTEIVKETSDHLNHAVIQIAQLESVAKRFTVEGEGPNMLADMARAPISQIRASMEGWTETKTTAERALVIIRVYSYKTKVSANRSTSGQTAVSMKMSKGFGGFQVGFDHG